MTRSSEAVVRRIVDLSHLVDETVQVYPGDPVPAMTPAATIERDGYNVLNLVIGSQTGTHVDAPYHFLEGGPRIDDLDLSLFIGRATIVDVTGRPPRTPVTWQDLAPYEHRLGPGHVLILHTGWSQWFRTPAYYDHPYLDGAAAQRLVALGVRTVGIDALNIDETVLRGQHPTGFAAHHAILGAGGVIAENLTNLAAVDFTNALVSMLPVRLARADGAPVRAVAMELA